MARDGMGGSCLSCVVKPYAPANEDAQRRRCPKGSKCGARIKDHKGISAVANAPSIKPRVQNIPTWPSLLPAQRFMRIIWKPSIPRCDDVVRPIVGAPICMQKYRTPPRKIGCLLDRG